MEEASELGVVRKVHLNTSAARVVLGRIVGIPDIYSCTGRSLCAVCVGVPFRHCHTLSLTLRLCLPQWRPWMSCLRFHLTCRFPLEHFRKSSASSRTSVCAVVPHVWLVVGCVVVGFACAFLHRFDIAEVTGEDGCVTMNSLAWRTGPTGPAFVMFISDDESTVQWTCVTQFEWLCCAMRVANDGVCLDTDKS